MFLFCALNANAQLQSPETKTHKTKPSSLKDGVAVASESFNFAVPDSLNAPKKIMLGRVAANVEYPKLITWKGVKGAQGYWIEILDAESGRLLKKIRTKRNVYVFDRSHEDFYSLGKGYYFLRVAAIGKKEKLGQFSACRWTRVGSKKELGRYPQNLNSDVCSKRLPAAVNRIAQKFDNPHLIGRNRDYSRSQFQVDGSSFIMGSILDQSEGDNFALAMLTSVRSSYWVNKRHGFEGLFRSKVVGYNELGNDVNPTFLEGRYHLRWKMGSFWKSLYKELQMSLFVGYEKYTNSVANGVNFTTGYSLMKLGLAGKAPLFDSWDLGGELVYGSGESGSTKIEFQGYLNYYFKDKWSLGGGYRLHLFDAGTADIVPDGRLPYREAYGEAFGNIRYSF